MPPPQAHSSAPIQHQDVAAATPFWRRKFAEICGVAFSLVCFLFIAAVIAAAYSGQVRPFGLDFENLVVYTAPEIAMLPWVFYGGGNALSIAIALTIFVGFLFVRFLIGYVWGKIFSLLHNWHLKAVYVAVTLIALALYGNFVLYNAVSIEQISRSANTVEDCAKYKDSASGYMPICVNAVAIKNNDPDLCLRLEDMGWDGFSYNCLQDYAVAKNDPSVCAKMGDRGNGKDTCYAYFKLCEQMSVRGDTVQMDSCYIARASDTHDRSACAFVQNTTRIEDCVCVSQYGYYSSECREAQSKVRY